MAGILSWLAPLLVLGIVIFVHELGHFLAAKWAGVYAPRFSLGWGSPLWSFRYGETEYCLSWLPIGGYVRMASRDDETMGLLEGGSEGAAQEAAESGKEVAPVERSKHWDEHSMIPHGPLPIPADRWFESKPLYKRLVIMLAGVFMNVVLALAVFTGLAAHAGIMQPLPPVIDSVVTGSAAAAAGLVKGDSMVAIDGRAVTSWTDLTDRATDPSLTPFAITVWRAPGETRTLTVTPRRDTVRNPLSGDLDSVPRIGVASAPRQAPRAASAGEALKAGWNETWTQGNLVFTILKRLVSGRESMSNLQGPIGIMRTSVQAARVGMEVVWAFIGLLSINLAVLNLLPIPLMDGGQIVLNIAQSVYRKPLPNVVKDWYARIGLVLILALFVTVTFNDLKRIVLSLFGG